MEIELFYTPRTRAGRVRWLLEELGLPYTLNPVDLFRGERNPAHPLGNTFSCADILVGHTLTWLPELIAPYPPLLAYTERLCMRDAFRRARQHATVKSGGAS